MTQTKRNIAVIYYIPDTTIKKDQWVDGFTTALKIMRSTFDITMINIFDQQPTIEQLNRFDFLLIKSNWRWIVDQFYQHRAHLLKPKSGLMISGSSPPFNASNYDILFYETTWYESQIKDHPNRVHAFGIDTDCMRPKDKPKDFDWISVGAFRKYKRFDRLLSQTGRGIVIGEYPKPAHEASIKDKMKFLLRGKPELAVALNRNAIQTLNFVTYDQLCDYYNRSHKAIIPAKLQGGGERCLLEARACGLDVEIADDNPKLQSLLDGPIYDHNYYAQQMTNAIFSAIN